MNVRKIVLVVFAFVLGSALYAGQEQYYPKGNFEVFPQPQHQQSRLEGKSTGKQRNVVWTNNCESASGWQLSPNWEIGSPSLGPNYVPEGNSCLATGLSSLYANSANIVAQSAIIQLPAASYIELSFQEFFELESNWDFGYVEVLAAGQTYSLDARTGITGFEYRSTSLNLTRFQNQSVQLQFRLVSDGSVPAAGWYLDDFSISAVEPLELDLRIASVNHRYHPSVYLTASVNSPQGLVSDLSPSNFSVMENGNGNSNMFSVICPDDVEQVSATDIVFVLDVTGSMSDEINAVRANMTYFMNALNAEGMDYRIGFVVFGDIVHVYNQYDFYTDFTQIMSIINGITLGEHGIGSGGDLPENQLGAMAEAALFQWRPGASRVMIMLTDASSHEGDNVCPWTVGDLLAERLLPNSIIVFPIFDIRQALARQQFVPIAEQTNPDGSYYHIYDNFNSIITKISDFITSLYTVHFVSDVPFADTITRMVKLHVERDNYSSEAQVFYIPGISPFIERSAALLQMDLNTYHVVPGSNITFDVNLRDRLAPGIQDAQLFWRRLGQSSFSSIPFTRVQAELYRASLPGSNVSGYGIQYYIQASDGQSTVTLPSSTPQNQPFCIVVSPNNHVAFSSVNAVYTPGTSFDVYLNCIAPSSTLLKLYYRPMGSLVYRSVIMAGAGGNSYTASIDTDLGILGVQYYVQATQTTDISSFYGSYDAPILLIANLPPAAQKPQNSAFKSLRVYPNPLDISSSALLKISFELKADQAVELQIYNLKGQRVRSLGLRQLSKGLQEIQWDGTDEHKHKVSSGIYLYRISAGSKAITGKVLLSK